MNSTSYKRISKLRFIQIRTIMIYNLFCLVTFANLLVLSSGANPARPPLRCRKYEVLAQCDNPCPPTCSDPDRQPCPTFACNPECICKPGYIRVKNGGRCIPKDNCPVIDPPFCPTNQTFQTSGFDCSTCRIDIQVNCAEIQESKCYCNAGYVKQRGGNCVLPDDCPDGEKCDCSRGFTFARCGNCNNNCASIGQPPAPCPCVQGCACNNPYTLDQASYSCVLKENCPPM